MAGWLAGWLALAGRLVGSGWLLVGWLVGCLVGGLAGWLVGWLVGCLAGWLNLKHVLLPVAELSRYHSRTLCLPCGPLQDMAGALGCVLRHHITGEGPCALKVVCGTKVLPRRKHNMNIYIYIYIHMYIYILLNYY